MEIGTDTDILLSSFAATDANHDTPEGGGTRAGSSFSKRMFPSPGGSFAETGANGRLGGGAPGNPLSPGVCEARGPRSLPLSPSFKMVGLLSLKEISTPK